ncbi:hypothetical protein Hanom_Chr05g00435941 [Helianthus anomalus]
MEDDGHCLLNLLATECARAELCEKKELGMLCCFSTIYYLKEYKQYKLDGLANVSTVNTSSGKNYVYFRTGRIWVTRFSICLFFPQVINMSTLITNTMDESVLGLTLIDQY